MGTAIQVISPANQEIVWPKKSRRNGGDSRSGLRSIVTRRRKPAARGGAEPTGSCS
jgi:hypothetical protein